MSLVTEINQVVASAGVSVEAFAQTLVVGAGEGQLRGPPGEDGVTPDLTPVNLKVAQVEAEVNAITADPVNAVTSWSIPAKAFDLVQGAPTFSAVTGRLAGWQFAQSVAGYISTPLTIPSHWLTMDAYIQWVNTVANSGNVVLGGEIHQWGVGDSVNVTPIGGSGIFAANTGPWIVTESKVASNLGAPLNSGKNTTLRIARQGASSNDTLLNPIAILAVRLVKKS